MSDPYLRAIGAAIRLYRTEHNFSQEDLGHAAGIHRTYVGGIERGERNPTVMVLRRFSTALECQPSELLREAETFMSSTAAGE